MVGGWLTKGFLVFLLTFAFVGLAHGQTKSADLPVQQRVICVPALIVPADAFGNEMSVGMSSQLPAWLSDFATDEFRIGTTGTEITPPEMGIVPWAVNALLQAPAESALFLANPLGLLLRLL